jgi:phosphate transport system permease protein
VTQLAPTEAREAQLLTAGELGDEPRRTVRVSLTDVLPAAASAIGAGLLSWTVTTFMGWRGLVPLVLLLVIAFVVIYTVVVREQLGREAASDRVVAVLIGLGSLVAVVPIAFMVGFLVVKGLPQLKPTFFTDDLAKAGPLDPRGGAFHAIVGTLEQVGLASVAAIPLGLLTAVYLHELKGRLSKTLRFLVDAMSGIPSVVAGLLIFATWVIGLHQGFSGFAASLALLILMLPTITRTSEEVLRTISDSLREASLALGAPQWRTVAKVVVPTARTGLVTAVLLGIARAVGETAPMLMTARGQPATNFNPFKDQQSDLPLFIYGLKSQPDPRQLARAYSGALVLLLVVLVLFTFARIAGRQRKRRKW